MTRRGHHRSAKLGAHRQPRVVKRPRTAPPRKADVTFCLWSKTGVLVKQFEATGRPPFVMDEGIRYERMEPHISGKTRHYQATVFA